MSPGYWRLLYLILGQSGWLICVVSAARHHGWIGVVFVALLAAGHLSYMRHRSREAIFIAFVAIAGWVWESLVLRSGWLVYPDVVWPPEYAPFWMAGLWALFALQINTLFGFLRTRWVLASLLGAVGGPLSYRAGAALGAIDFVDPWAGSLLIASGWAVMLPALIWLGWRMVPTRG